MKKLFTLFTVLMMSVTIWAQVEYPVWVGGEDSLSRVFSREFSLDTPFVMKSFEYMLQAAVTADGEIEWQDGQLTSPFTVYQGTSSNTNGTGYNMDYYRNRLLSEVKEYLSAKIANHEFEVQPGTLDGAPAHMPVTLKLVYSPVYYAQSGDTLHCTRDIPNRLCEYGEKDAMFYQFDIRNNRRTLYYAVVHRHEYDITMHYFDTLTNEPFLVEKYVARTPTELVRAGYSIYIEGNKLHHRQFFEVDTMRYVETYGADNRLYAKYYMTQRPFNAYPFIQYKEVYYPSGQLQRRIDYPDAEMERKKDYVPRTHAYREDGSDAKYKPSSNLKFVVGKWFRKNFKVPYIKENTSEINYIAPQPVLVFYVGADGKAEYRGKACPSVEWQYNYRKGFSSAVIDRYIYQYYGPYLEQVLGQLAEQTLVCKPSTIDKQPVESIVVITLEFDFTPR